MKTNISGTWCVNPYTATARNKTQAIAFAQSLGENIKLEPVFMVTPAELNITYDIGSIDQKPIVAAAQKKLHSFFGTVKPKSSLLPAKVVFEKSLKLSDSGKHVAAYAKKKRSNFILTQHQKNRMGALGLGSFTQALLFNSSVPVIVMSNKTTVSKNIASMLFCTDFSAASLKAFKDFCQLAKKLNAKVIVFHAVVKPTFWFPDAMTLSFAGLGAFNTSVYLDAVREKVKSDLNPFVKIAKQMGVETTFMSKDSNLGTAEAILKFAKTSGANMIGMAAESTNFWGNLLGSVTLKIASQSSVPVWVKRTR